MKTSEFDRQGERLALSLTNGKISVRDVETGVTLKEITYRGMEVKIHPLGKRTRKRAEKRYNSCCNLHYPTSPFLAFFRVRPKLIIGAMDTLQHVSGPLTSAGYLDRFLRRWIAMDELYRYRNETGRGIPLRLQNLCPLEKGRNRCSLSLSRN